MNETLATGTEEADLKEILRITNGAAFNTTSADEVVPMLVRAYQELEKRSAETANHQHATTEMVTHASAMQRKVIERLNAVVKHMTRAVEELNGTSD